MHVSIRHFAIAALSFAAVAPNLATAAHAAPASTGMHIQVGDLAQPDAARDFDRRLQSAAVRFCSGRYHPTELAQLDACESAVREEGLAQLSWNQREAFERSTRAERQLASR